MTGRIANEDDWGNFSEFAFGGGDANNLKCISFSDGKANHDNNLMDSDKASSFNLSERLTSFMSHLKPTYPDTVDAERVEDLEHVLSKNEIWKTLIHTCGDPKALNWSKSLIRSKCFPKLNDDPAETKNDRFDSGEKDGDELRELMDLHSLVMRYQGAYAVESEANDEALEIENHSPVPTADEVIEEIEEILLTADEQAAAFDNELEQQTGIIIANDDPFIEVLEAEKEISKSILDSLNATSPYDEDESDRSKALKDMSFAELNEELTNLESSVKFLSEGLLKELNLRDELLFEKEVRNTFITKILEVQYKQEQFQLNNKAYSNSKFKFGNLRKSLSMSNASVSATPGRFLTTVIPFDDSGVPSMEGLQALIKLLDAIKDDSSEVPSLITDYILKVLCPAPSGTSMLKL